MQFYCIGGVVDGVVYCYEYVVCELCGLVVVLGFYLQFVVGLQVWYDFGQVVFRNGIDDGDWVDLCDDYDVVGV